jgi:hypothetical protein
MTDIPGEYLLNFEFGIHYKLGHDIHTLHHTGTAQLKVGVKP